MTDGPSGRVPAPLRAPRLRPGDVVGIVSPSWGGAAAHPRRLRQGMDRLRALGFEPRLGAHAGNTDASRPWVSDTAEHRAADLHDMFADPDVRAIVATIGGDHSCQILRHLDFDALAACPTILCGFSDVTVLNVAIHQRTGLVTFNGPALLTDFAEHPDMPAYTRDAWLQAVTSTDPVGVLRPSEWWTEEFLDWSLDHDLERPRERLPSPGWTWLVEGEGEGPLVGGCLESLEHLRGTPWWPDMEGAVLFWETSEGRPSPARVDACLSSYQNMGLLEGLAAMLVGRPMRYTDDEKEELRRVVALHAEPLGLPVVTDVDFGHTSPQLTLPLGCRVRVDSGARSVEILDAAVTD